MLKVKQFTGSETWLKSLKKSLSRHAHNVQTHVLTLCHLHREAGSVRETAAEQQQEPGELHVDGPKQKPLLAEGYRAGGRSTPQHAAAQCVTDGAMLVRATSQEKQNRSGSFTKKVKQLYVSVTLILF